MANTCPICGAELPDVADAFCPACRGELPQTRQDDLDDRILDDRIDLGDRSLDISQPGNVGLGLAIAALVLPVLAGIVLLLMTDFWSAFAVSAATVVLSSLLVAIDAHRLGHVDRSGRDQGSAVVIFLGMVLLWIVFYPIAFYRRSRFAGPNLLAPSIIVALFFAGGPLVVALIVPPALPSCTSREVVPLVEQVVRQSLVGAQFRSIDGHQEIAFDAEAQRRQGRCVVHTDGPDVEFTYFVEWQDRSRGLFQVRIPPADVPLCTSRDVIGVLEKVIRGTPVGAKATAIDGHREMNFDPQAQRRLGQCVVHTPGGDIVVNFIVAWQNRERGEFTVQIVN